MLRFPALSLLTAATALAQTSFPLDSPSPLEFPASGYQHALIRANKTDGFTFLAAGENGLVRCLGWRWDPVENKGAIRWDSWTSTELGMRNGTSTVAGSGTRYIAVGTIGGVYASEADLPRFLTSIDGGATWQGMDGVSPGWLEAIAFGNGTWVAVGTRYREQAGFTGLVQYSTDDGGTWNPVELGEGETLFKVRWNGTLWVAVGEKRTASTGGAILEPCVYTSLDGVAWIRRPVSGGSALHSVTWGHGQWVAVGGSYPYRNVPYPVIYRSPDGIAWTDVTPVQDHEGGFFWDVDTTVRGFIAVGDGRKAMHSPDGRGWEHIYSSGSTIFRGVRTAPMGERENLVYLLADTGRAFQDTLPEVVATTGAHGAGARSVSVRLLVSEGLVQIEEWAGKDVDIRLAHPDGRVESKPRVHLDARGLAEIGAVRGIVILQIRDRAGNLLTRRLAGI